MAEFEHRLIARAPLGGADLRIGENRIRERADIALVSVATPQGGETRLASALGDGWGLEMPTPRLGTVAGDFCAIRTAPDQMLLLMEGAEDAVADVAVRLDGAGYITDQTGAWVMLDVSGPETRAALERLCPLDLDPAVFPVNAAARTVMEHLGTLILRPDEDRFLLLSASSSAGSFLHAVETSYRYVLP